MRIGVLSWESLYTLQVGGLGVVATRLCEELAKVGHEVYMFTRGAPGQPSYMYINGVNYYICEFDPGMNCMQFAYNMSMSMVKTLREVEKYEGKFDVIHGHDWMVVDALDKLKKERYPVVLTFHSTEYGRNGSKFGDWWEFREISKKEWWGGQISDVVTTVSNAMKGELNWLYKVPMNKIEVIPNAVDPAKYQLNVDPAEIKKRYGIDPSSPLIHFVGRMEYQKGPDLLVEAIPKVLESHPQAMFVFSGSGGMKGYLEQRARELGVSHAVKFLGFVPYREFLEILNACDIVCLPSRNEPFGIALLEAWAAGKPVVATDVGGLGENIENFVDGVKVFPWPDSIAWGINYLLESEDGREFVARGGREKVKKFSWANSLAKLLKVYERVLG